MTSAGSILLGTHAMLIEEPIFGSVKTAVRFGVLMSGKPAGSTLWRDWMTGGEGRRPNRLGNMHDHAAQAGMIMTALRQGLTPLLLAVLQAKCIPPEIDCACGNPCCSGSRPNFEWEEAATVISRYAQHAWGTDLNPRLARAMILRAYEERPGKTLRLAKRFNVKQEVLERYEVSLRRLLKGTREVAGLEADAWDRAGEAMRRLGVVAEDA